MGWKFQNAIPTVFIRSEPNFMINMAVTGEYKVIDILAIYQKLRNLRKCYHISQWES